MLQSDDSALWTQHHRLCELWMAVETIHMVPDNNGDPVDLNPVPTCNEASGINSDGIVYDPFDRPPGEEVVEAIPRARSRSPSRHTTWAVARCGVSL